jgi:hypothetical protein
MKKRQEFVKLVARIWRCHDKQGASYKSLMGKEISGRLRKVCCIGYMCSLLFKKEINHIYGSFKCPFLDGDLNSITESAGEWDSEIYTSRAIAGLLIEEQNYMVEFYEMARNHLEGDTDSLVLCADHLAKLKDLTKMLTQENNLLQRDCDRYANYRTVA